MDAKEINILENQILSSNAYQIRLRMNALSASYYIYNKNYLDLKVVLKASSNPEFMISIWDIDKRDKLDKFLEELRRRLHNFLAGAGTLTDHTRNIINIEYKDTAFQNEYQKEVDRIFTNDPLSRFIKDFRSYMLHRGLPATYSQMSLHPIENSKKANITVFAKLDKNSLMNWKKWTKPAKQYLISIPDEPKINEIVDSYNNNIVSFYSWLQKRFQEIHRDDLEWLKEKTGKLNEIMSQIMEK